MSDKPILWKFILILAVVAIAGWFTYPPKDRINLGLDLRGGSHIVMEVDTDAAVKYQLDLTQSRLGQSLKEENIGYESILATSGTTLELRGTDGSRTDDVRNILDQQVTDWEVSAIGSSGWRVTMPPTLATYYSTTAVDTTLAVIRERIDSLGVSEPLIQKQGVNGDRILVQVPGVENSERLKLVIKSSALLEWKEVTYPPGVPSNWRPPVGGPESVIAMFGGTLPDDTKLYAEPAGPDARRWWPLKTVSVVTGNDLLDARRDQDELGRAVVSFQLSPDAGKRFEVATRENVGKVMAIVLGGTDIATKTVRSAPTIEERIRDRGQIAGSFSVTEAVDLAMQLRSGAIPTDVDIIEERTVGPSLGADSIRAGLTSGLVGFIGVLIFMVVYYRFSGINAVVALALNILLVFGALGALPFLFSGTTGFRATLTLPGIAGLILTVGMAVDSNVLIFERIREELRLGKTVRSAVDQGFGKAFLTILDCNVTTVVAAIFLAMYGTGPVRGFAVTLVIGLMASMFTAVFVSRQLFELVLSRKQRVESLSI